jgi:predicted nuclease with TOPRIM domain
VGGRPRLRSRSRKAEDRIRDLEALLRRFTKGEDDPASLQTRLAKLEAENHEMKERIRKGRDGVERLLSRIRFLEDRT